MPMIILHPNDDTYDILIDDYIIIITKRIVTIGLVYVSIDSQSEEIITASKVYNVVTSMSRIGLSAELVRCEDLSDMRIYYRVIDEFTIMVETELETILEMVASALELNDGIDV